MNRIVCPKCRANNMPGQPSCFQCGSSLPPPEAFGQSAPSQPQPYAAAAFPAPPPFQQARRSPWPAVGVVAGLLLLIAVPVLLFSARSAPVRTAATPSTADMQAAELDQLRKAHGLGSTTPTTDSGDDGTRRELNRLREKYGINTSNPHNPNGESEMGKAMTFDQWRRQNPDPSNYQFR
jgi:hypothetical protein